MPEVAFKIGAENEPALSVYILISATELKHHLEARPGSTPEDLRQFFQASYAHDLPSVSVTFLLEGVDDDYHTVHNEIIK